MKRKNEIPDFSKKKKGPQPSSVPDEAPAAGSPSSAASESG